MANSPWNRYLRNTDAIVYNRFKTADGWRIEAVLPKRVKHSDRVKVLNWLEGYRSDVRRTHPFWVVALRVGPHSYALDIHPVEGPKEFLEKGNSAKNVWDELIAANG